MAPFQEVDDVWRGSSLLTPIVAMSINLVTQVIMVRARHGAKFFRSMVEGFLAGGVAAVAVGLILVVWQGLSVGTVTLAFFVNLPAYAALSYCYLNVANLGQTSIRIRLYSEISAGGGMSEQEIERIYNHDALMRMRLERLIESGDLVAREGRYFVGRKRLVRIANILVMAKRLILGKRSEFE